MSVIVRIPSKSPVQNPSARFLATFNTPTLGKYDFTNEVNVDGDKINLNVPLISLEKQSLYLVTNWRFRTTVTEDLYQEGIADNNIPTVHLNLLNQSKTLIFSTPLPMPGEIGNSGLESLQYFTTTQDEDILTASLRGQLDQIGDLINFSEINATFSITMYQINDPRYVSKYLSKTLPPGGLSV